MMGIVQTVRCHTSSDKLACCILTHRIIFEDQLTVAWCSRPMSCTIRADKMICFRKIVSVPGVLAS